jgi:hypothetical protein
MAVALEPVDPRVTTFDPRFHAVLDYSDDEDERVASAEIRWAIKNYIWASSSVTPERGFALLAEAVRTRRHREVRELLVQVHAGGAVVSLP